MINAIVLYYFIEFIVYLYPSFYKRKAKEEPEKAGKCMSMISFKQSAILLCRVHKKRDNFFARRIKFFQKLKKCLQNPIKYTILVYGEVWCRKAHASECNCRTNAQIGAKRGRERLVLLYGYAKAAASLHRTGKNTAGQTL